MPAEGTLSPIRIVRWWLGELRACIPGPLSRLLFGGDDRVVALLDDAGADIAVLRQGTLSELGRVAADDARSMKKATHRLLERNRLSGAPVTLHLPKGRILRPRIDLPVEAADNLRNSVALDMDRHTPFSAEDVVFDLRVAGLDAERQRLKIDLVVARKADLDRALATARAMGLKPGVVTAARGAPADHEFNLLPPDLRPRRSNMLFAANAALALLCCGLGAAAVWQQVERREQTVDAYEAKLVELRRTTGEADRLGEKLDRLIALSGQLITEKTARASMISIIDEVTKRIPDESWLTSYAYQDGMISITGYSDDPSNLLRQLETSDMFSEVRFAAPVTMDPRVERERFNISMAVAAQKDPQ